MGELEECGWKKAEEKKEAEVCKDSFYDDDNNADDKVFIGVDGDDHEADIDEDRDGKKFH